MTIFRVCLCTSEPDEPGLLDYLRCHGVRRSIVPSTVNTGFEEFWYSHPDRDVLLTMMLEFWGPDSGNDEHIELVHQDLPLTVGQLVALLAQVDQSLPVTVVAHDGAKPDGRALLYAGFDVQELPFQGPIVTHEGGGAAPEFYALNVVVE